MLVRFLSCSLAFFFLLHFDQNSTFGQSASQGASSSTTKPIRALLIAGGCCHDYAKQQEAICQGIQSRANVRVDVYWTDNSTTTPVLPIFLDLNWANNYDEIIHDECAADVKDEAIIQRIVNTHAKIPAVHLHCAMHSFRAANDVWFKHLGLQSSSHGPQEPIDIHYVEKEHPITKGFEDWTTIREELYNNVKLLGAKPLAIGKQKVGKGDKQRVEEAVVVWVNESMGAKSFSTSIGHNTETVQDARYLDLITRGLLWACDKLTPEYLVPYQGDHSVTFIDKNLYTQAGPNEVGKAPQDSTLVKVTASSTQAGNANHHAIDGKPGTRWCADGPTFPEWIQLEFEKPQGFGSIAIDWETPGNTYRYRVEGSNDGISFELLLDQSTNQRSNVGKEVLNPSKPWKFLRITCVGASAGWCSIRDIRVEAEEIKLLWPASIKEASFTPMKAEAYAKSGNMPPRIEALTADEEAAILRDVKVADGFEATVFASPPAVNYPVFVGATVDGTVFVSSDGNGSLGRDPMRGRVIRLRDLDGDGRADETKVFCHVDAPRGLVWDGDRLFLMHPPHLSAFIDRDGDGVADEQKILVKNLAFGYDKRPADHTTNGVSLGLDGWLYIAGGDFGFMDAEGTDGRKLTHRGGGVIRVRPDGSGLELYSTGTRNILEVAISPTMDMFARDNTNDGGGWDVRMHHFTGNDDHGYPRLYKNFSNECVAPLADYGGGSGCGAVFIDEPGFGKWNNAPFTADWGTGAIYRHSVTPFGATFQEASKPEPFVRMTRPTDADVDGNSRVYCASWRGATFAWEGTDVGYLICVKPKGYLPTKQMDYRSATVENLVKELDSPSYRRRLEATRELDRRGDPRSSLPIQAMKANRNAERNLLDELQSTTSTKALFDALEHSDPLVVHTAIRVLGQRKPVEECLAKLASEARPSQSFLRAIAMMHDERIVDAILSRWKAASDTDSRQNLLLTLCRLHYLEGKWAGDSWGTRPDTRGPYYQPEEWSGSVKIKSFLDNQIKSGSANDTGFLIDAMQRNRLPTDEGLERLIELAQSDDRVLPGAIAQLSVLSSPSNEALPLLIRTAQRTDLSDAIQADCINALSKSRSPNALIAMFQSLQQFEKSRKDSPEWKKARTAFGNSPLLESQINELVSWSQGADAWLIDTSRAGLLAIVARQNVSPEALATARKAIQTSWEIPGNRKGWIEQAASFGFHGLDDEILDAMVDPDKELAKVAEQAAKRLKLSRPKDETPKLKTLKAEDVIQRVKEIKGDVAFGQRVFTKANCVACHTVRQDEVQKGPYLGNIAKTYPRPDLATAIVDPGKTIAQGFITNIVMTNDEETITGFVTNEKTDQVTLRDQKGIEHTILKSHIEQRKTSTLSSMPGGLLDEFTVLEFASLLDYLESLSK